MIKIIVGGGLKTKDVRVEQGEKDGGAYLEIRKQGKTFRLEFSDVSFEAKEEGGVVTMIEDETFFRYYVEGVAKKSFLCD